jgi:hypothetical protein
VKELCEKTDKNEWVRNYSPSFSGHPQERWLILLCAGMWESARKTGAAARGKNVKGK